MTTKPIKPEEVNQEKRKNLPDYVIEAFNQAIAKNWTGKEAKIMENEMISLIIEKSNNKISRKNIFDMGLLNVEAIYRQAGWWVFYARPKSDDNNYEAYFIFKVIRVL